MKKCLLIGIPIAIGINIATFASMFVVTSKPIEDIQYDNYFTNTDYSDYLEKLKSGTKQNLNFSKSGGISSTLENKVKELENQEDIGVTEETDALKDSINNPVDDYPLISNGDNIIDMDTSGLDLSTDKLPSSLSDGYTEVDFVDFIKY